MELSAKTIHDIVHPTAAFAPAGLPPPCRDDQYPVVVDWTTSRLNPKNRIDSLAQLENPLWRIDAVAGNGIDFFVIPLFLESFPFLRVGLMIPEHTSLPLDLQTDLEINVAFYTRDARRIRQLAIANHLLRIMQHWTHTLEDPKSIYDNLPWGSTFHLEHIPKDVRQAKICIKPSHHVERQLMSIPALHLLWGDGIILPPEVDLQELKTYIFKAVTSYTKYLYHEIYQLLNIPPHPNVISRPVHLVTKKCAFGGKTGVVGFTLEYHEPGSIRDHLPFFRIHSISNRKDEIKWCLQLASALIHIRQTRDTFYPDLRLDNIVLSKNFDVIMVDFEQRGVWCEFASPEVNAIDYIRMLEEDSSLDTSTRSKYAELLEKCLPNFRNIVETQEFYTFPNAGGFNIPWMSLTPIEQEAAEVYMLGRVMWCIFEATSAPQRASVWLSYIWEPLDDFPSYTTTPPQMRDLIDRCTRGRRPGLSRIIVRKKDKLVLRALEHTDDSTPEAVHQAAQDFWVNEVSLSEKWLDSRLKGLKDGSWKENYYQRPTLSEIRDELQRFYDQYQ